MDKRSYRLCLALILCAAATAIFLYYRNVIKKEEPVVSGTLVYLMPEEISTAA